MGDKADNTPVVVRIGDSDLIPVITRIGELVIALAAVSNVTDGLLDDTQKLLKIIKERVRDENNIEG